MGLDITIPDKPVERTYTVNAPEPTNGDEKLPAPWTIRYMVAPARAEAVAAYVDTASDGRREEALVALGMRFVTAILSVERDGQAATTLNGEAVTSDATRRLLLDYVPGCAGTAGGEALSLRLKGTAEIKN